MAMAFLLLKTSIWQLAYKKFIFFLIYIVYKVYRPIWSQFTFRHRPCPIAYSVFKVFK